MKNKTLLIALAVVGVAAYFYFSKKKVAAATSASGSKAGSDPGSTLAGASGFLGSLLKSGGLSDLLKGSKLPKLNALDAFKGVNGGLGANGFNFSFNGTTLIDKIANGIGSGLTWLSDKAKSGFDYAVATEQNRFSKFDDAKLTEQLQLEDATAGQIINPDPGFSSRSTDNPDPGFSSDATDNPDTSFDPFNPEDFTTSFAD